MDDAPKKEEKREETEIGVSLDRYWGYGIFMVRKPSNTVNRDTVAVK